MCPLSFEYYKANVQQFSYSHNDHMVNTYNYIFINGISRLKSGFHPS